MWIFTLVAISSVTLLALANTCPKTVASKCGRPLRRRLNDPEKVELLAAHNERRNFVALGRESRGSPGPQPPAANMQVLTWNDELESLAQSWADQCDFSHNRCGGSSSFSVGQNLYMLTSTSSKTPINLTKAVGSWYNEVQYLDKSSVSPFKYTPKAGHYSQLVWANSRYLGCGYIVHPGGDGKRYKSYLVCNYGPAGNVIGGSMYKTSGGPCSGCPRGRCSRSYTGLCG